VIKVRFIHDGRHKGWRYREGEEVLLTDSMAKLAIDEGVAVQVVQRQNAVNRNAYQALEQAKRSLK
jgi:protein-disulfide isomerase-like protein with CxxC motif